MEKILDLHIHSKYSRACSPGLTLEGIDGACRTKGVDIVGTGDMTHPAWFSEIEKKLEEIDNSGLYKLKQADGKIKFILSGEVSLIYKEGDKTRKIHLLLHSPNKTAAKSLNKYLDKKFNIRSDGRPILGIKTPDFIKLCLDIHPGFMIYPAHIWTPWFSVFGSKSGFNNLEECFQDQLENIFAYETGLSSDPEMNWLVSDLDNLCLLSNSDAHSLSNIGREANIINLAAESYDSVYQAVKNKKVIKTIEFFPEEGMYYYDGHRGCGSVSSPELTKKRQGICPICGKPLTLGVLYRLYELADRRRGFKPKQASEYAKLVELDKIIAEALKIKTVKSKKVMDIYKKIITAVGPELDVLLKADLKIIARESSPLIAEGIRRVRAGELKIAPGFDGQYGIIKIFS
jgi:uncharacterized protein (TIGR00375 family)